MALLVVLGLALGVVLGLALPVMDSLAHLVVLGLALLVVLGLALVIVDGLASPLNLWCDKRIKKKQTNNKHLFPRVRQWSDYLLELFLKLPLTDRTKH